MFDASTLSQNRRRRYTDTSVAQDIFDAIVEQAIAKGLVDGTVLYTDSTHLKANANKNRYDTAVVAKSRADYWDALDAAIEEDRQAHGKKPLPQKERQPVAKETKISRTDPEAGYMVREGKPKGFFFLDHRTVDGRFGIITDTFATPRQCSRLDRLFGQARPSAKALRLRCGRGRTRRRIRHFRHRAGAGTARHPWRHRLSPANPATCRHDGQQAVRL